MEKVKRFRGKTFCSFKTCFKWWECKDRLSDEIKQKAFKSKKRKEYPLMVFAKEPKCFRSTKDYLEEVYPLPKGKNSKQEWKPKEIIVEEDIAYLPLANTDKCVIIDAEDVNKVKNRRWYYSYQCGSGNQTFVGAGDPYNTRVFLHRLIKGAYPKERVKFIDGDPLNCRKSNLFLKGQRAFILKLNDPA